MTVSLSHIRASFLDYFQNQGHTVVSSAPLVPINDPSLMFTAAGMVPFKNYFTGLDTPPFSRATSSQKCLRAGGKHNDLDNVGYTTRHHTFFEMLGNFSFGDYFKEEAIFYAWDLVTRVFGLKPKDLLVTVHASDPEAAQLWRSIAQLPEDRILSLDSMDNFWTMGDTGPCGPCTEIFFDRGEGVPGGPPGSADEDGERFTEIWNLVFMQYERHVGTDGQIQQSLLPKPCVDTGMGLERIGAVLQGVRSNFETDLFQHLIQSSMKISGSTDHIQSHQVIADHIRACAFLLTDGVLPSNEGRGYVLRRIMRRAMRHAHVIGCKEPLMHRMVTPLIDVMGESHPEILRAEAMIKHALLQEEEKFRETLGRGMKLLQEALTDQPTDAAFSGDVAFKLYDTYGFPVDLTEDILKGMGRTLDKAGFDHAMQAQKEAARASWVGSGDARSDGALLSLASTYGATKFVGYETLTHNATIQALIVDGNVVEALPDDVKHDASMMVVVDTSPFYAESGGQMGDRGVIRVAQGAQKTDTDTAAATRITNTTKIGDGLILHHIDAASLSTAMRAALRTGQSVVMEVDENHRNGLRRHHSATHLLHAALRQHFGDHVTQKGSRVDADRLRFDFTHDKPLSKDDIQALEHAVNTVILDNDPTTTDLCTPQDAFDAGAIGLFGEKYGDQVRVVSMGGAFSKELCGGTHVRATGDIGSFKITNESGVAAGIRRIEAVVGHAALRLYQEHESCLSDLSSLLKVAPHHFMTKIKDLQQSLKQADQTIKDLKKKQAHGTSSDNAHTMSMVGDVRVLFQHMTDYDAKDLKPLMDQLKTKVGSGIVLLTNVCDGKVSAVLGITPDIVASQSLNAGSMIKELSPLIGGQGGGGRPDLAQAGGHDAAGIIKMENYIKEKIQKQ